MSKIFSEKLDFLRDQGGYRILRKLEKADDAYIYHGEKRLLNLSSNDYLGIATDQNLQKEFYQDVFIEESVSKYSLGVASSRLLAGDYTLSHELEEKLAFKYGKESALLFNSGYHANIGLLPALFSKKDLIISDKLNHASIHDGIKLGSASCKRFNHSDYEQLERILITDREKYDQVVIVTESIFSMDGDCADLNKLVVLKEKYNCLLYVDEAHAVGMYGEYGLGKCEELTVLDGVDFLVGTFGKAFGSIGAFVICSRIVREYLINTSRSLIFTTALPPVVTNWNSFILDKISGMAKQREKVQRLSAKLRLHLKENGLNTFGETNIIPIIIGDNSLTTTLSKTMEQCGYFMLPIRPPTVPKGSSRFRLSITANMKWSDLENIAEKLKNAMVS